MLKRFWYLPLLLGAVGMVAGILTIFVLSYTSLAQYEVSATIQVRPGIPETGHPFAESLSFFESNFDLITSAKTQDTVINELDLINHWQLSREDARNRLSNIVSCTNIRGTDLIEITVKTDNPSDSAMIANAICTAFQNRLREIESTRVQIALEELRKAIITQEKIVDEKRKVLTQLILDNDSIYEPTNLSPNLHSQRKRLESQLDTLLRYDGQQLITYAAGLDLPENIVRTLHPRYLELEREYTALKDTGLEKSHPKIQQQKVLLEALEADLAKGAVALRETLRTQLELVKKKISRLETKKNSESTTNTPKSPSLRLPSFDDAKTDFETAQDLLEELKIKLITEEMGKRIMEEPAVIHKKADESNISKRSGMGFGKLAIGSGIGLFGGVAFGFILMPILHSSIRTHS